MYYWCGNVWSNRNGLADRFPEVYNILKKMNFGHIFETQTDKRYKLFWEFIEKNGRLPKQSLKEEKSLYLWCRRVWKDESNMKKRFPDVYAKLKEMRWGESVTIKTESIAASFWEFIEKNGRLPKISVKEESSLYQWCLRLWNNHYGLADKFPEVYAKLKEMRFGEGNDIQTEERVKDFFKFVEKNGRLPKHSVKEEYPLWLWCQRVGKNESNMRQRFPEVYEKLKEMGWTSSRDKTQKRVDEFWEFVNTHGRLPKQSVKEEKPLYSWYIRVLKNESNLQKRFPEVYTKIIELKEKK